MISRRAFLRSGGLRLALLPILLLAGCARAPSGVEGSAAADPAAPAPQPPAAAGAMAPYLAAASDGSLLLSWLEPEGEGHRLRVARLAGGAWGQPSTVAAGDDFFANWADVPSVVEDGAGTLYAHWLARLGGGTYAYGVQVARSDDGGASWEPLGLLHDDRSPTEHGFVTLTPLAGGGIEAVWLDGRATAGGGAMTLRARRLGGAAPPAAGAVVDASVCDCCSTAAVVTARGLLVAYRDRADGEVRDVSIVRRREDGWSPPRPLHRDGWTIPGCPVNGPALAARGERAAAAWFTAADGRPRVLAAASRDAGATWSEPVEVDAAEPLGRVGVALVGDDAVVSWLGADGGVRLARVAPDGRLGRPHLLAVTAASRASGVPRLVAAGGRLHVAWVEAGEDGPRRLRFATLSPSEVPS